MSAGGREDSRVLASWQETTNSGRCRGSPTTVPVGPLPDVAEKKKNMTFQIYNEGQHNQRREYGRFIGTLILHKFQVICPKNLFALIKGVEWLTHRASTAELTASKEACHHIGGTSASCYPNNFKAGLVGPPTERWESC